MGKWEKANIDEGGRGVRLSTFKMTGQQVGD
jgi:hypothetical protein